MPTTTDTQPRAPHRASDAHVYDAAARLAAEYAARGEAGPLFLIATRAMQAESFLAALGPERDALAQAVRDRLAGEANAYGMALAYALGVTHPADTLTPCDRDKLAQYVLDLQPQPCPRCAGLNGSHGFVHVRHGNGGGHNEPCPASRA